MKKYLIAGAIVALVLLINSCSCPLWFNNGCEWGETWLGSIAHADMVDDEKKMIERCEFAVKAARVPPGIPVSVVCEKPFRMIDGDEVVTVVCAKFCRERGIK